MDLRKYKKLKREEERELLIKAQSGNTAAREKLILHNMGLVYGIARKIAPAHIDPEELISDGVEGLCSAIEKFKVSTGNRLSTYAHIAIKRAIERSDFLQPAVRLPENLQEKQKMYRYAMYALSQQGIADPSPPQVASFLGWKLYTAQQAEDIYRQIMQMGSLDAKIDTESYTSDAFEIFEGEEDAHFEEITAKSDVAWFLSRLSKKEREIVCYYFGIGGDPKTLREISQIYAKTFEWVRQLLYCAMENLKEIAKVSNIADPTEREHHLQCIRASRKRPFSRLNEKRQRYFDKKGGSSHV